VRALWCADILSTRCHHAGAGGECVRLRRGRTSSDLLQLQRLHVRTLVRRRRGRSPTPASLTSRCSRQAICGSGLRPQLLTRLQLSFGVSAPETRPTPWRCRAESWCAAQRFSAGRAPAIRRTVNEEESLGGPERPRRPIQIARGSLGCAPRQCAGTGAESPRSAARQAPRGFDTAPGHPRR
jgi:hypothetical protein